MPRLCYQLCQCIGIFILHQAYPQNRKSCYEDRKKIHHVVLLKLLNRAIAVQFLKTLVLTIKQVQDSRINPAGQTSTRFAETNIKNVMLI